MKDCFINRKLHYIVIDSIIISLPGEFGLIHQVNILFATYIRVHVEKPASFDRRRFLYGLEY